MSELRDNDYVNCHFCAKKMYQILLCNRKDKDGRRCHSIICCDCGICEFCDDRLHESIQTIKKLKNRPTEKNNIEQHKKILKEEYDIDL